MKKAKRSPPAAHEDAAEPAVDGRRARRMRTEQRLIEVVGELLSEGGVSAVFINAVAARAEVEKVLIYRYFGGLEGLMAAYAARSDFWPTVSEVLGPKREALAHEDKAKVAAEVLIRHARALQKRPITVELLGWECAHRNPLTVALETVREERTLEVMKELTAAGVPISGGLAMLAALFGAALNYLAVRSRALRVFGGVRVGDEQDWELLRQVMESAARGVIAFDAGAAGGTCAVSGDAPRVGLRDPSQS